MKTTKKKKIRVTSNIALYYIQGQVVGKGVLKVNRLHMR